MADARFFTSNNNSDIFRILSAARFNHGCPSLSGVVNAILEDCGVSEGMKNTSSAWTQVVSYLGGALTLDQGAGQTMDSDTVNCLTGFLDAFVRGLPSQGEVPAWLVVVITLAACAALLAVCLCATAGAGVAGYCCYWRTRKPQVREEESSLLYSKSFD